MLIADKTCTDLESHGQRTDKTWFSLAAYDAEGPEWVDG